MATIEIDDDVWGWLKGLARPFEDTPNTVLRRVAGLEHEMPSPPQTARAVSSLIRRGRKTPQGDYRNPILRILARHKGQASRHQVLHELEQAMRDRLTDYDRSDISSGTIRWQKSAEWEVSTMRQAGLLKPQHESPRGIWCFTPKGAQIARTLSSE